MPGNCWSRTLTLLLLAGAVASCGGSAGGGVAASGDALERPDAPVDADSVDETSPSDSGSDSAPPTDAPSADVVPASPPALTQPATVLLGDAGNIQVQPSLAFGADGGLGVAWAGKRGDEVGIFFALYRGSPLQISQPTARVNTDRRGVQSEPRVCPLPAGGYALAWSMDNQEGGPTSNLEVHFRLLDLDGVPLSADDVAVDTGRSGNHWLVDAACLTDGFALAGVRPSDSTPGFEVFVQRYDAAGLPAGEALAPLTGSAGQLFPAIAASADDGLVVAWEDANDEGSGRLVSRIVARRIAAEGTLGPLLAVAGDGVTDAEAAIVAMDPASSSVLASAWVGSNREFWRFAPGGDVGATVQLPEPDATTVGQASIAAVGGDRFAVFYYREAGDAQHARLAYLDPGGDDVVTVATERVFRAYRPSVTYRQGRLAVAWTETLGGGTFRIQVGLLE